MPRSSVNVRVNWTTVTKNGTTVKTGDVVSVCGKERLKVRLLEVSLLSFWFKKTLIVGVNAQIGEINETKGNLQLRSSICKH